MVRLIVVRHGHSFGNKFDFRQGQVDFPLAPSGIEEAERLDSLLPEEVTDVYSSDLRRASETVEFSGFDGAHHETELLREMDFGRLSGITVDKDDDRLPYSLDSDGRLPADEPWPDGESYDEVTERATKFCEMILSEYDENEVIGVVTHQGVIHAFQSIAGTPTDDFEDAGNVSGFEFTLEPTESGFNLERVDSIGQ